ncbi:hypothetical protein MTO96_038113 [Rhipicephalus appendiculatus]
MSCFRPFLIVITINVIKNKNSEMDQTAYRDYPPSAPLWPMNFYPPYHPDYYCPPPPPPYPAIAPAIVPAAFVRPEAAFPAKNESPGGDNASSLPGKVLVWGTTLAIAALLMTSAVLIFWRTEGERPSGLALV